MTKKGFLGMDIGSTTVKVVLLDEEGKHLTAPLYIPSIGQPLKVLRNALHKVVDDFSGEVVIAITGSGRDTARRALDLPEDAVLSEIYAHASGVWHVFPGVRSIVDIGGQDSKLIRLRPNSDGTFMIEDFVMNDLCAAGTGAFLELHARDLGYSSIEEFSEKASRSSHTSRIAGRCSILAHSDVVHLRQNGESIDNIAAGLCRAVVINVLAMVRNKPLRPPVSFQGGVAANAGVVRALRTELNLDEAGLIVPPDYKTLGALGAAFHAIKRGSADSLPLIEIVNALESTEQTSQETKSFKLVPLKRGAEKSKSRGLISKGEHSTVGDVSLGFDVGSASVKIAAIDLNGDCVFTYYALHDGRPIEALYKGLTKFRQAVGDVRPRVVTATGSGRDMVELKVGADININEITAQGLGAQVLDPEVDTIFEIGGQDSKYIRLEHGHVADFEMNRICAAGTGAFVAEAAKIFGVSPGNSMDDLVFASEQPTFISNRCCVFAKSDMVSFLNSGVPRSDVAAGTIYAVIKNYLTLVVGNHAIGKHILFLGGLAKNSRALVAALENLRPNLTVSVLEGCEVSGALGAAHLGLSELRAGRTAQTRFRGFTEKDANEPAGDFVCPKCSNLCHIQKCTT